MWLTRQLKKKRFWEGVVSLIIFILLVYTGSQIVGSQDIRTRIETAGPRAPFVLILIQATMVVLAPLSSTPLYILAATLFNFWPALLLVAIGDTIGYAVSFLISRYYGRGVIEKLLTSGQLETLDHVLEHMSTKQNLAWAFIIFFGVSEVVSYAAGLSQISFIRFISVAAPVGTLIASLYVSVGSSFTQEGSGYISAIGIALLLPGVFVLIRYIISKKQKTSFI